LNFYSAFNAPEVNFEGVSMNLLAEDIARIALIGVGATAVMDLWLVLLKALNVPTLNFALIGRWAVTGKPTAFLIGYRSFL
jgi:hypothetical protein